VLIGVNSDTTSPCSQAVISETSARLVPICRQALRLDPDWENPVPYAVGSRPRFLRFR
jgi:hypothetical protein